MAKASVTPLIAGGRTLSRMVSGKSTGGGVGSKHRRKQWFESYGLKYNSRQGKPKAHAWGVYGEEFSFAAREALQAF